MQFLGHIEAQTDTKPFRRESWLELIEHRTDLVRAPSRMARNPATGQLIEAYPPADAVGLFRDECEVGSFSWGPEEQSVVDVFCKGDHREFCIDAAREFARLLGGVFTEYTKEL